MKSLSSNSRRFREKSNWIVVATLVMASFSVRVSPAHSEELSTYQKVVGCSESPYPTGSRNNDPVFIGFPKLQWIVAVIMAASVDKEIYHYRGAPTVGESVAKIVVSLDSAGRIVGGRCAGILGIDDLFARPVLGAYDWIRNELAGSHPKVSANGFKPDFLAEREKQSIQRVNASLLAD